VTHTAIAGSAARHLAYGLYAWSALVFAVTPALLLLVVTPGRTTRRRVTRWFARAFFLSIGSPIRVDGATTLPEGACVVVANHASYLDGIVLTAALPARFTFVIKHEMVRFPFAGFLLRRIGSEFVNREDGQQKSRVTRRLFKAAESGDALAFFPEGTFNAAPGLRRFQPGAFSMAWRARLPVVPVVISGTRAKLPANVWLPAPGPLSISVGEPIDPDQHASAGSLLTASRDAMLARLAEPDLAEIGLSASSQQPDDDP
jgi:1-acyl-sn-glycerol-3-phosphate acyltransferase